MLPSIFLATLLAVAPGALGHPLAEAKPAPVSTAEQYYDSIWVEAYNATFLMLKREPESSTTCGSHTYTTTQQKDALSDGSQHSYDKTTVKAKNKRKYPEPFGNRENLAFTGCKTDVTGGFIEFPILRDGTKFKAKDDQGPDRIVYKRAEKLSNVYRECGCMTHENAPTKNGFVLCTN